MSQQAQTLHHALVKELHAVFVAVTLRTDAARGGFARRKTPSRHRESAARCGEDRRDRGGRAGPRSDRSAPMDEALIVGGTVLILALCLRGGAATATAPAKPATKPPAE